MPKSTQQRIIDTKPAGRKATAFAASATGSGTPVPTHALNGAYHTGTLDDAQAPQFLKTDGSRALTGNLSVSSGVTIDGVDLSAHVADLAAHHAAFIGLEDDAGTAVTPAADYRIQVLGGDGLASTAGSNTITLAVDSTVVRTSRNIVAGNGLTGGGALSADVTLDVNTGAGVEIVSDAVRVDEDYAFTWTVQHTFSAGLSSSGDVVALQDLYVGGSTPSSATLFVDASLQSVGINRQPDSQFALDISGPARATWFVGPHAIQLDNARDIFHLDSPSGGLNENSILISHSGYKLETYNTSWSTLAWGKFQGGVALGSGGNNVLNNPDFVDGVTGWSSSDTLETITASDAVVGSSYLRVTYASGSATTVYQDYTTTTTGYWSSLAFVRAGNELTEGSTVQIIVYSYESGVWQNTIGTYALTSDWQPIWITHSAGLDTTKVRVRINCISTASGAQIDVGGVWLGSTQFPRFWPFSTTNSVNSLKYDVARLNQRQGGVFLWAYILPRGEGGPQADDMNRYLLGHSDTTSSPYKNRMSIGFEEGSNLWKWIVADSTGTAITVATADEITASGWHQFGITWKQQQTGDYLVEAYLDGVQQASATMTNFPNFQNPTSVGQWLNIGSWANNTLQCLTVLDEITIVDKYIDSDQVRAVYESNAPVFAESSVFSWRAPSASPVWVDEEGLWVRTSDSVDVFGVYAGDATKTWGGLTLTAGDALIGNSTDGYVWFDKDSVDATKLKIKSEVDIEGTSTVIGNLTVSGDILVTTGKISAGNGYVYMDSQGISIQADSDAGTGSVPVFDPEYGIEWYGVVATKSTHIGGIYGYSGSGFLKGLWIQSQPSYDIMMNPGSGGTVVIDGNCNVASNLTVDNNLTVSGSTATINAAVSISDTVYVGGNMEAAAEFAASGNVALLTSSYPSDAFKGIYINNGSENYTSWHIVEDGYGASHMIAFGARYLSSATGDPSSNSNWKTDFEAGSYNWGPGLIRYTGNNGVLRVYISGASSGVDTNPTWDEKLVIRRDNAHAIYGNLTISGNNTVSGTLSVTGAVTLSSTLTVTGTSNGGAISTGTLDTSVKHADINTVTGTVEKRANIVTVQLEATNRGGPNYWPSPGGTICRLPSGFRPSQELDVIVHDMVIAMRVVIYTDGYVKIEQQQASSSAGLIMWMTVSFVAA